MGPPGPWRSKLYQVNWLPTTVDEAGRGLHDFSYAGFRRGEAPWKDPEPYVRLSDFEPDPTGEASLRSSWRRTGWKTSGQNGLATTR